MEEAKEKITNLTEDREFIGLYDEELEKEREYKDRMAYAEKIGLEKGIEQGLEKGIEQGLEKGIKQGKEKGILENKLETARNLKGLGIDMDIIAQATSLSKEEIEQL